MGLSETVSGSLSSFEKYNNKEVYNFGGFVVTGRLVSAFVGFIVISLMLMVTFSSAANSIQVGELGGIKASYSNESALTIELVYPDGKVVSGIVEDNISELDGTTVQFERVGFVRLEGKKAFFLHR